MSRPTGRPAMRAARTLPPLPCTAATSSIPASPAEASTRSYEGQHSPVEGLAGQEREEHDPPEHQHGRVGQVVGTLQEAAARPDPAEQEGHGHDGERVSVEVKLIEQRENFISCREVVVGRSRSARCVGAD